MVHVREIIMSYDRGDGDPLVGEIDAVLFAERTLGELQQLRAELRGLIAPNAAQLEPEQVQGLRERAKELVRSTTSAFYLGLKVPLPPAVESALAETVESSRILALGRPVQELTVEERELITRAAADLPRHIAERLAPEAVASEVLHRAIGNLIPKFDLLLKKIQGGEFGINDLLTPDFPLARLMHTGLLREQLVALTPHQGLASFAEEILAKTSELESSREKLAFVNWLVNYLDIDLNQGCVGQVGLVHLAQATEPIFTTTSSDLKPLETALIELSHCAANFPEFRGGTSSVMEDVAGGAIEEPTSAGEQSEAEVGAALQELGQTQANVIAALQGAIEAFELLKFAGGENTRLPSEQQLFMDKLAPLVDQTIEQASSAPGLLGVLQQADFMVSAMLFAGATAQAQMLAFNLKSLEQNLEVLERGYATVSAAAASGADRSGSTDQHALRSQAAQVRPMLRVLGLGDQPIGSDLLKESVRVATAVELAKFAIELRPIYERLLEESRATLAQRSGTNVDSVDIGLGWRGARDVLVSRSKGELPHRFATVLTETEIVDLSTSLQSVENLTIGQKALVFTFRFMPKVENQDAQGVIIRSAESAQGFLPQFIVDRAHTKSGPFLFDQEHPIVFGWIFEDSAEGESNLPIQRAAYLAEQYALYLESALNYAAEAAFAVVGSARLVVGSKELI